MEANFKKIIENISNKSIKEIIEDHVKSIKLTNSDEVVILIDRRYAFNILHWHEHIWELISWVKKTFWEEKETVLKLEAHLMKWETREHHDREMKIIPYRIHYK